MTERFLRGTVSDKASRAKLEGLRVVVGRNGPLGAQFTPIVSATTDTDGRFEMSFTPTEGAQYAFRVWMGSERIAVESGEKLVLSRSTNKLALRVDAPVREVPRRDAPPDGSNGKVRGQVRHPDGTPITGVTAKSVDPLSGAVLDTVTVDDNGRYALTFGTGGSSNLVVVEIYEP